MSCPPSHLIMDEGRESVSTSSEATDNTERRAGDEEMVDSSENVSSLTSSVSSSSYVCGVNEVEEISSSADVGPAEPVELPFAQHMLPPPLISRSKAPSPSSSTLNKKIFQLSATSSERPASSPSSSKSKEKLAKEKQGKYNAILSTLKYHTPKQAASTADSRYNLEVLKNGSIVDSVKFSSEDKKGYYIVGRVPGCDVVAENPTVSRLHAVLQFVNCPKKGKSEAGVVAISAAGETSVTSELDVDEEPQETGLYLFDLKSTHGTFLNKNQVFPNKFYRVHVGHVIKFGSSQRMYIVNGPSEDEEEESDKTVTELQKEKLQKDLERKRLEEEEQLKRTHSKLPNENIAEDGINWGMGEDADEESDLRINPFSMDYEASELSLDNPKKSLRSWFEREGEDLEYEVKEKGSGQYVCRIALPLDGPTDAPVYAESEIKAKKKEAAHDAALKACQILDSHGLLRSSNQESRKRKEIRYEDEDYYSSDEDTFLDRTGSVEKKREKRLRLAGKMGEKVETYNSLCTTYSQLEIEISDLKFKIEKSQQMKARADDGEMDIDDYMKMLKTGVFDAKKLRSRLKEVNEEMQRTMKLIEIAKPAELPSYLCQQAQHISTSATSSSMEVEPLSAKFLVDATLNVPQSQSTANESDTVHDKQIPHQSKQDEFSTSSQKIPVGPMKSPTSSSVLKGNLNTKKKLYGLILPSNLKGGLRPPDVSIQQASIIDDLEKEEEEEKESSSGEEDNPLNKDAIEDEQEEPDQPEFIPQSKKKKRQRYRNKQKSKGESSASYAMEVPNYSVWVPPDNQSGDGRTSLNEKLGY